MRCQNTCSSPDFVPPGCIDDDATVKLTIHYKEGDDLTCYLCDACASVVMANEQSKGNNCGLSPLQSTKTIR